MLLLLVVVLELDLEAVGVLDNILQVPQQFLPVVQLQL
jgi:hypothetical protein